MRRTEKRYVRGTLRGSRNARARRKRRGREAEEEGKERETASEKRGEIGVRCDGKRAVTGEGHVEGGCKVTSRRVDTHSYYCSAYGDTVTPR